MLRKWLQFGLGMLVSLAAVGWALYKVSWVEIWRQLQNIQLPYILLASSLIIGVMGIRAWRWRLLFYPNRFNRLIPFFEALSIGYLVNNLMPFRAGDVTRALLIGETAQLSKAQALMTIVVERVADLLSVLLLLLGAIPFLPTLPTVVRQGAWAALGLVSVTIPALLVLSSDPEKIVATLSQVPLLRNLFVGKLSDTFLALLTGLRAIRSPRQILQVGFWSLAVWLGQSLLAYTLLQAFTLPVPFTGAMFIIGVTGLGIAIPSSPCYIGVYHALVVLALTTYAIAKEQAVSYALVLHGLQYLWLIVLGAVFMGKANLSILNFNLVNKAEQ